MQPPAALAPPAAAAAAAAGPAAGGPAAPAGAAAAAPPLSKRQLKRQATKERNREERHAKYGGLSRSQRLALEEAVAAVQRLSGAAQGAPAAAGAPLPPPLDLEVFDEAAAADLRRRVGAGRYAELPFDGGPQPAEGAACVAGVLDRVDKYQAKMAPQEYSLLHKLWRVCGGDLAGVAVIDIGGGNGCLAVLCALLLGVVSLIIDRDPPPDALRAELSIPEGAAARGRVLRMDADVAEVCPSALERLGGLGVQRVVLLSKHLCGMGTDLAVGLSARLLEGPHPGGPRTVGMVAATCCGHKISDPAAFAALYRGCWGAAEADALPLARLCAAHVSWRTTTYDAKAHSTVQHSPLWRHQQLLAELFEDVLQAPRAARLRRLFPAVSEVRFADPLCTPQNRCITAAVAPPPQEEGPGARCFLAELRRRAAAALAPFGGTALYCRPQGLASNRYGLEPG
eukprot:TRINITY_DN5111_c2_g1_i5.p1 TRINITY_DN5111_c2_g1~~TRINITY_DN5111_c2_g1_i5.p1  ORF type:complete len:473 (+),score=150.09 TRINITY_DN5111_c2_g1_i5:57-1421(+)